MKETAKIGGSQTFGLGERVTNLWLEDGTFTLWAFDAVSPVEDGVPPGKNMYGVHPIYYTRMTLKGMENQFIAVFDNNAGAQDFIKDSSNGLKMTHIKTSGFTERFLVLPQPITDVVRDYQRVVGLPAMVPQWALGWQQTRWGYTSANALKTVVDKY